MPILGDVHGDIHDQSVLLYDDSWMLIYGNGDKNTAIYSDHPMDKLLRALMVRLLPYETDPRVRGVNAVQDFSLTQWQYEHPPLPELGPPAALEDDMWVQLKPKDLIQQRLKYEPKGPYHHMKLEHTDGLGTWPDEPWTWPDTQTLPIPLKYFDAKEKVTLLRRWRLDRQDFEWRPSGEDAEGLLAIILYFRMLGSTPLDKYKDGVSRAPKHILSKIRAILLYANEAYKCITEEDIEAIYQEVREGRNPNSHKKVRERPTNAWDEWMPIINHVRYGRANIKTLNIEGYSDWDYNLRPTLWDERFTARPYYELKAREHFPVRMGCRTWDHLKILRRFIESVWYNRILRGAPPLWREDMHNRWLRNWISDNTRWYMDDQWNEHWEDVGIDPSSPSTADEGKVLGMPDVMQLPPVSEDPEDFAAKEPRPDWVPDI